MKERTKPVRNLREKYWCELTTEEKVERMRDILKRIMREMDSIRITIDKIRRHKHDPEGLPIVEERLDISYDVAISYNEAEEKGEVYF
jgi:hypothetical protein